MICTIMFLCGVGLCIYKHPVWGVVCFVIALLVLLGGM